MFVAFYVDMEYWAKTQTRYGAQIEKRLTYLIDFGRRMQQRHCKMDTKETFPVTIQTKYKVFVWSLRSFLMFSIAFYSDNFSFLSEI